MEHNGAVMTSYKMLLNSQGRCNRKARSSTSLEINNIACNLVVAKTVNVIYIFAIICSLLQKNQS